MIKMKDNNCIDETELDFDEAVKFIEFLKREIQRHKWNIIEALKWHYYYKNIPVLSKAWKSSVERHQEDIYFSYKTIKYLQQKFGGI
jgi:hypothetical protein